MKISRALLSLAAVLAAAYLPIFVSAQQVDLKFERQRANDVLNMVSGHIEKEYYDPKLHGVAWQDLLRQARDRIEKSQSAGQMYTAIFLVSDSLNDSHTVFIPPQHVNVPQFGFDAMAYGDEIRIFDLTPKGAAQQAGLQRGDRILTLNGYNATRAEYDKMNLYFRILRPVVALDIGYQRGSEAPKTLHLEAHMKQGRAVTDLTDANTWFDLLREDESAAAKAPVAQWADYDDGVKVLKLRSFAEEPDWYQGVLGKVKDAKALVLDLRGNRGGRIDSLRYIASCFVSEPTVLADVVSRKKTEPIRLDPKVPHLHMPLVVLIDSESSSAAEAFPKFVQVAKRGTVVGDHSMGRLTVAKIFPDRAGYDTGALFATEVSVARFVFPNGEEVEGKGVTPDYQCLPGEQDLKGQNDPCAAMAINVARKALNLPEVGAAEKK
jgi:carboxyl-terminal processing protease